jgi:glucosamine-6-phosphate deaminase
MTVKVFCDTVELGKAASAHATAVINTCIAKRGKARIVLSTGASQFELFKALAGEDIDWGRVEAFHLDEYIGLPSTHKASFRKYLKERFVDVVRPGRMRYVIPEGDVEEELKRLAEDLISEPVDLGFIGIGENAHIAFNDPPADFGTTRPYIAVTLNEACKAQQVREGWFPSIGDVPKRAVTMSVHRILQCNEIISCVPGAVKADAVLKTLTGEITPMIPAAKLREHGRTTLYLDEASASLLDKEIIK